MRARSYMIQFAIFIIREQQASNKYFMYVNSRISYLKCVSVLAVFDSKIFNKIALTESDWYRRTAN